MAMFYCIHKRLQLEGGVYYCLDCQAKFDVIPFGAKLPVIREEIRIEPKPPEHVYDGYGKWNGWKWVSGGMAAVIALGAFWSASRKDGPAIPQAVPQAISVSPCEPKIIEKEVPVEKERIVYQDRECPEIKQQLCSPEVVYVPQKANCAKEIEASCRQCRESLEFFLKREKMPSEQFRLDSEDPDEFDKEF